MKLPNANIHRFYLFYLLQDVTVCRARVVTALDSAGLSRIIKCNFEHNHKRKFPHSGVSLSQQLSIMEGATGVARNRAIKKKIKGNNMISITAAK